MTHFRKKKNAVASTRRGGLFTRRGKGTAFVLGAAAAGAAAAALGIAAAKRKAKARDGAETPVQAQPIFRFAEEDAAGEA